MIDGPGESAFILPSPEQGRTFDRRLDALEPCLLSYNVGGSLIGNLGEEDSGGAKRGGRLRRREVSLVAHSAHPRRARSLWRDRAGCLGASGRPGSTGRRS